MSGDAPRDTTPAPGARALPPGFHPGDAESERGLLLRESILDALHVALEDERENDIGVSFSGTYDWIFDSTKHDFGSWLSKTETTGDIFWINGYPGSGKSTLMRHIHSSSNLVTNLQRWSGNQPVTIARFYFWESGSVVQRSLVGLLRSLLSQLLIDSTHLIPWCFADLWVGLWIGTTMERVQRLQSWNQDELVTALERYFRSDERQYTFLMIDGLDEFDGDDDAMLKLLELLRRIAGTGRVKLCVSSRPWPVFEQTFGTVPTIRLQDLTSGDMERYISGRLWSPLDNPGSEDQRNDAEKQLLRKADGVFLWITFAIADLLTHCGSKASIEAMTTRIGELPAGLNSFLDLKVLRGSPLPQDMSRVFQLMRARQEVAAFTGDNEGSTMSLWELVLANEPRDARELPIQQVPMDGVEKRCRGVVEMVSRATQSLVRTHDADNEVDPERGLTYIHRTVKEWLSQPSVWTQILALASDTNPHLLHLRAVVSTLRLTLEKPRRTRTILAWWSQVVLSMTHARFFQPTTAVTLKQMGDLLELLDETLEWYYFPVRDSDKRLDHWARSCMGTIESRGKTPYEEPFLSLAVRFGVREYVRLRLERQPLVEGDGQSVLSWAVIYLCNRQQSVYPLSNPDIVIPLLESGLDPNHRWIRPDGKQTKTPWMETMESVQQGLRKGWIQQLDAQDTRRWTTIVSAFLLHGADPGIEVCATHHDDRESVVALLGRVQAERPCAEVEKLAALLDAKRGA